MVERNLPKVDTRVRFPSPAPFYMTEKGMRKVKLEIEQAIKTLTILIEKSVKAQMKFLPGSSQHTLLTNRIQALRIANALLHNETNVRQLFTKEDLEATHAPLLSLISKSEKTMPKLKPDTWQYTILEQNIEALKTVLPLIEIAINEYRH